VSTMTGTAAASCAVPSFFILDSSSDSGSSKAASARERSWYAESPIGIPALRYAEAQELLRDQRLKARQREYWR
jgi:hypothetical protein